MNYCFRVWLAIWRVIPSPSVRLRKSWPQAPPVRSQPIRDVPTQLLPATTVRKAGSRSPSLCFRVALCASRLRALKTLSLILTPTGHRSVVTFKNELRHNSRGQLSRSSVVVVLCSQKWYGVSPQGEAKQTNKQTKQTNKRTNKKPRRQVKLMTFGKYIYGT